MSFDFGISLISASLAAVKSINDGSFFLPLFGIGAKYGLSVSKIICRKSTFDITFFKLEFLVLWV